MERCYSLVLLWIDTLCPLGKIEFFVFLQVSILRIKPRKFPAKIPPRTQVQLIFFRVLLEH